MKIYNNLIINRKHQNSVVAIGNFDGIHIGHQKVISQAIQKAKKFQPSKLNNSVAASDAFFPFVDGIKTLINSGVKLIVQPGGSIRDKEVIDAANKAKIKMIFTNIRHFNH